MNKTEYFHIMNAIFISILLNIFLPILIVPFATSEEIKPPIGASSLSFKGQFMHMMVHHKQVPFMSSMIIGLIVGLAVFIGIHLTPFEKILMGFESLIHLR